MSLKTPEPQNYDKFVSLNEYVLVSIMRHLESATNYLLEADQAGAILNLNYAWTITPTAIKRRITESPSDVIEKRIKAEVPSLPLILRQKEWLASITMEEIDIHVGYEGGYYNEMQIRAELYQRSKILGVIQSVLFTLQMDIVEGLEKVGLYITFGGGKIIPTSNYQPKDQPPLEKVPITFKKG